jgi:FdhD protein
VTDRSDEIEVLRVEQGSQAYRGDMVALEGPLEIQLHGRSVAVIMRTPGNDEELAVGFLVTEGVVTSKEQLASVHHSSEREDDDTLRVLLADGADIDFERLKRNVYASSSCGVCGKASLEAALACAAPLDGKVAFDPRVLISGPDILRGAQELFDETGAVHGAALVGKDGALLAAREDVGRHNAVDKLIGWALLTKRDVSDCFLVVSGRVSFEIVQKALAARIPAVVAVSAPTSLAVDLAERANMLVAGFVRGGAMNVYAGADRLL